LGKKCQPLELDREGGGRKTVAKTQARHREKKRLPCHITKEIFEEGEKI